MLTICFWKAAVYVANAWAMFQVCFFALLSRGSPREHAVALMTSGLFLCRGVLGGVMMYRYRDKFARWTQRWRWHWQVRFTLLCTLFALVEEAIATTMTNLAPVFGVPLGDAYITASTNYLDVVLGHSVVVFVPMFACWAWILSRWRFAPRQVLVLFGLTGVTAEVFSFGLQNLLGWGFWVVVYGLMVYLPTYAVREEVGTRSPQLRHYVMAVVLPFLVAVPVAGIVYWLHPVSVHFEPIER